VTAVRPTRIELRNGEAIASLNDPRSEGLDPRAYDGGYVDASSFDDAATALQAAYEGLQSAANQFAAMRESQNSGHFPEVHNNPEKFEEKAAAASAVLARLGIPTSPAPAGAFDGASLRPGSGGDKASSCGAGTAQAEGENDEPAEGTAAATPSASAGDGGHPPKDAPSAGGDGPSYRHRGCGGAVILTVGSEAENQWDVTCRDCGEVPGLYDVEAVS